MDCETEYITQSKTNTNVKRLEAFLSNEKFRTPKGSPYTNVFNQRTGGTYFIPPDAETAKDYAPSMLELDGELDIMGSVSNRIKYDTPIEEFFALLEECRRNGAKLSFSEKQDYYMPPPRYSSHPSLLGEKVDASQLFKIGEDGEVDLIDDISENPSELESAASSELDDDHDMKRDKEDTPLKLQAVNPHLAAPTKEVLKECTHVGKSCIELDFDIYQRESVRVVNDTHYFSLVQSTTAILQETIDVESCKQPAGIIENSGGFLKLSFHSVILRKPEIVEVNHPEYGRCYKDSFHYRIYLKVSREYKKYFIKLIQDRGVLSHIFNGLQIINPLSKSLDTNSSNFPPMLLGSMKRTGTTPQEFHRLYDIQLTANTNIVLVKTLQDFDPVVVGPTIKIPDPRDRRKKIEKTTPSRYNHNLCYETSLMFEKPGGFIKKREFDPKKEILSEIRAYNERSEAGLIPRNELEEVKYNVTDLAVRNYEAKYLQHILNIISPARVKDFMDWKSVIIMLARANPDYKPLAIWFSHRCPRAWVKEGLRSLESIWQWALDNPTDPEGGTKYRNINTLFAWAKEDNPEKYNEIQELNAFMKLKEMAFDQYGELNETQIAEVLKVMFGQKFVCDENVYTKSRGKSRQWYEFVFPGDDLGLQTGSIYKWRLEKYPDNLDKYISKKLPRYMTKILEWVTEKADGNETDEKAQKYYETVKKNMRNTIKYLGKSGMIANIISRCEIEFRVRGFEQSLDRNPDVIGVGNGVLQVYPKTELLQRYHEIPICRTNNVDYIPYDPTNPYVKILETELRRLFADEPDAYHFVMLYLSSSLDGRKKNPLFFIWLGEGSNGKSFLLELHIGTLHHVVDGGYAAKMNMGFFVQEHNSKGPDSELMMLKFSRFAYCSESKEGDVLQMARIKEIVSETLTGNEKYGTQDMFEANCHFVFCSNHDPRVTGRDYGTWRRLLVYRFKMVFRDSPDPNNRYEYKRDPRFTNVVTKDPNYKRAYLSILVKYYEEYRDKYNCDLNNVPKPTIDKETLAYQNDQDTISRFITEQVVEIKPEERKAAEAAGQKIRDIPLTDVANRYIAWHVQKIDDRKPVRNEILNALRASRLKKFIVDRFTSQFLMGHRILDIGEDYDSKKKSANREEKEGDENQEEYENQEEEDDQNQIEDTQLDDDLDEKPITKADLIKQTAKKQGPGRADNIEDLVDDLV